MKQEKILEKINGSLKEIQEDIEEFFSENLISGYEIKIKKDCISYEYYGGSDPFNLEFRVRWEQFYYSDEKGIFFHIDTSIPSKGIGTMFPFDKMDDTFFEHVNKIIALSRECIKERVLKSNEFEDLMNEFRTFLNDNK